MACNINFTCNFALDAEPAADFAHCLSRACRILAKAVIVAAADRPCAELFYKNFFNKILGRKIFYFIKYNRFEFKTLFDYIFIAFTDSHQHRRCNSGYRLRAVLVKEHGDGDESVLLEAFRSFKHSHMTDVHTVEVAERNRCSVCNFFVCHSITV